jgi:hypothetical protein
MIAALAVPAAAEEPRPDFSGLWQLNTQRSDDIRAKIEDAAGSGQMRGDSKFRLVPRGGGAGEARRVELRAWMLELAANAESELLEIEQTPTEFLTGFGDNVRRYYFARERSRQTATGEILKASIRWAEDSDQLVVEEKGDDSHVIELYTLLPDEKTLMIALRWENRLLSKPLEVNLVLEREESEG